MALSPVSPPPAPLGQPPRKLLRSANNRMIAGVMGGIAEYLGWNATVLRLLVLVVIVVSATFTFGGTAILYLIAWMIMPDGRNPANFDQWPKQ